MRTAEEWHDEVCRAADATHGAIVEVVRRIQAEALEEAARVCDRLHDVWRAAATNAYHEGGADALDVAGQEVRSLSPKEEPSPSPTGRETP